MVDKILVREYLSNLKEDRELDYIFALLLESMGFQIIRTAQDTKGQSQYGKDIIAIGKDTNGKRYRWYFEVKGYDQKDININTIAGSDKIFQSLVEAKYTKFEVTGFKSFNSLPTKIVIVHNGITDPKFQPTFSGIIDRHFSKDEFEDWDINRLADYFSENLFNAYIFTNPENVVLLKRFLIFLSVPEYDFSDIEVLLNNIYNDYKSKGKTPNDRNFKKLFSTLNLLMLIAWHYSSQINNLLPAKYVINLVILRTWAFILEIKQENSRKYKKAFSELISTQKRFYHSFFDKTFNILNTVDGLFMGSAFSLESITYPLRSFEYIDDIIYIFRLSNAYIQDEEGLNESQRQQKKLLIEFIDRNKGGCTKPILDSHLIAIHHVFKFFLDCKEITQEDGQFLIEYFHRLFNQIVIRKRIKGVYPYASKDLEMLIELEATGIKNDDYPDKESLLIAMLMDYVAIFDLKDIYEHNEFKLFLSELDLQFARPNFDNYPNFEQVLFERHLDKEYFIENVSSKVFEYNEFRNFRKQIERINYPCRSQKAGFGFLITLAQSFYKNEPFPEEWREWFDRINVE